MKNKLSRVLWAVPTASLTVAIILVTLAGSRAVAQDSGMQQRIQQSIGANQQRLAHYSWQEQSRSPTWCIAMCRPTRRRCSRPSSRAAGR